MTGGERREKTVILKSSWCDVPEIAAQRFSTFLAKGLQETNPETLMKLTVLERRFYNPAPVFTSHFSRRAA